MGIGNWSGTSRGRQPDPLITPHGDREHACSPGLRFFFSTAHYPSWGSGTRRLPAGLRHVLLLITPHGDRERITAMATIPGAIAFSLPLMGIGNKNVELLISAISNLITPHGDRERMARRPRPVGSSPHYPSWGSGTTARRAARAPPGFSLPLMGIGNPIVGRTCHDGRFGSLPLMGIGNTLRQRWRTDMIVFSLPLMGIGNRTTSASTFGSAPTHYPSWGSGTRISRSGRSHRFSTHYPSWGSGTCGSSAVNAYSTFSLPLMGIGNPLSFQRVTRPDSKRNEP